MPHASDALRDAATFSKVFERAPLSLAISALETGTFIAVNDTFLHSTGYGRDEVIGRSALELGLWVDVEVERAGRERLERQGVIEETETRLRMKSGEVRTFLISAEVTDLDGRRCLLYAAVDITERKRAEADTAFRASLLDNLHDAVIATDARQFVTAWNRGAERLFGYDAEEVLGRSLRELVASDPYGAKLHDAVTAMQASFHQHLEITVTDRSGVIHHLDSVNVALRDPHGGLGHLSISRDISERKRAEARLRFLSEASDILFVSLDIEVIVERIAQLPVPVWADWCAVSLREDDGSIRPAGVAHMDPEKVRWARDLRERYPARPDDPRGTAHVIRTGASEFYPEITEAMLTASARDPEHLRLLSQVPYRSVMIVPLKSRGRTLGALTLVRAETPGRYDADDLRFAEELAARAGMAIDNARLFEASERSQRQLALLNASLERLVAQRTHQVRQLAGELTLAEARERSRLAQVLHDDLQQQLYAVQFSLRDIQQLLGDREEARAVVEETGGLLREALALSRATTADLSPPVLRGEGLVEALRWFGSEMRERYALEVAVEADESLTIPNEAVRVLLFDLVRELLFNVTKHADTDRATVRLSEDDDSLSIVVTDPGQGFDPSFLDDEPNGKGTGLGLSGVRKRLQLFDGQLQVASTPGRGTRITITMPLTSLRPQ